MIVGLILYKGVGVASPKVYCDSQVVVNKFKEECVSKGEKINKYLKGTKALVESFANFKIEVVPREANKQTDTLNKYV